MADEQKGRSKSQHGGAFGGSHLEGLHHKQKAAPTRRSKQNPDGKSHMTSLMESRLSIAVDPVALITTECITVTSAMRKHARWAHSSVSAILGSGPSTPRGGNPNRLPRQNGKGQASIQGRIARSDSRANGTMVEDDSLASRWGLRGKKGKSMQDNPLLSAFARLRNDLRGCTGMSFKNVLITHS